MLVVASILECSRADINPPCFLNDNEMELAPDRSYRYPRVFVLMQILNLKFEIENRLNEVSFKKSIT
jgi:hypothetical protein